MVVSIETFNGYSKNYEDSPEALEVKTLFLNSAQTIVEDYLRFKVDEEYPEGNFPEVITLSILRVATLMLMETGGNIGLTGKAYADQSRTFINYSNYRKYLQPLDGLRRAEF
ncbi:MAG: hypothetical protein HUK24_06135 [Sphaerochaetaceae bacterium]|nr:hypothetical protein [Sphaerochaetaceae bacterium]